MIRYKTLRWLEQAAFSSISLDKYQANGCILKSHRRLDHKTDLCFISFRHLRTFFRRTQALCSKKIPFFSPKQPSPDFLVQSQSLLKRQLNIMQVICIIHWTNPGSNMQITILESWLVCLFACTIDSVELERDLVLLSGLLPCFNMQDKVHRYFFYVQLTQHGFWRKFRVFGSEAFCEYCFIFGCDGTLSTWKESARSLVVFIPPEANTPELCEKAQARAILRRYHFNWAKKRCICILENLGL